MKPSTYKTIETYLFYIEAIQSYFYPMAQHTFLFEIGTEELPPGFLGGIGQWTQHYLKDALEKALISGESIDVYTTARRIGIVLNHLPGQQPDQTETLQGPPLRIAKDNDGNWSKAALAFAQKCGVDVEALETSHNGKNECLSLKRTIAGKPTPEVLKQLIPAMLDAMQGPRFMRWGSHDIRFPRPIQWLTALWDSTPLDIGYHHLTASHTSLGHRFLAKQTPVVISEARQYIDALRDQGHVIADPTERRHTIEQSLHQTAQALGGTLMPNDDLMDEVCQLVEAPSVITGNFDPKYLALPADVVQTVLASHQKYFTIEKDGTLLPHFLAISNASPAAADTIKVGYEKVVIARLSDAEFFFAEDQKKPLSQRLDDLAGMTFQRKLGTMRDKANRIAALSNIVANATNLNEADTKQLHQAALLCKADLTTHMVFEFTELEGSIGKSYALHQGVQPAIAHAIEEHYQPRFQGDELPKSILGGLLSITDKIDTLATVLSPEKVTMPTGSKDPMGLRRMVNGLLLTLNHHSLRLSIKHLGEKAYQALPFEDKVPFGTFWNDRVQPFIMQRLNSLLSEEGFTPDQIDCLCDVSELEHDVLDDIPDLFTRGIQLKQLVSLPNTLQALYEPANRLSKILAKQGALTQLKEKPITPDLFEHEIEHTLYQLVIKPPEDITELAKWQPVIAQFFEDVLVNADDAAVKTNRLALLATTYTPYARLGNWGKLQLDKTLQAEPANV